MRHFEVAPAHCQNVLVIRVRELLNSKKPGKKWLGMLSQIFLKFEFGRRWACNDEFVDALKRCLDRFEIVCCLQTNAVRYPLSLEMMFGVLDAAVAGLASRCKSEEARTSYLGSQNELARAYQSYCEREIRLGKLHVQLAHHLFRWGALPRSRSLAEKYIDSLQKKLTESERR